MKKATRVVLAAAAAVLCMESAGTVTCRAEETAEKSAKYTVESGSSAASVSLCLFGDADAVSGTVSAESAPEVRIVDREMTGEPIGNIRLSHKNGSEAYDGDITTDYRFSAVWDLTGPAEDGTVPMLSYTGKPEIFGLDLTADSVKMTISGAPWDMFVTDPTLPRLIGEAVNFCISDFMNLTGERSTDHAVNGFLRASVTTENGDTVPLKITWLTEGGGHFQELTFFFDRTVTEEAVSFSMELFLPDGVEPVQYPRMYTHTVEYPLWTAAETRPDVLDDISMSVTFERSEGYRFRITESSGCAEFFDAKLCDESLYLTTDAELSGELYERLKSCSRTEWADFGEYSREVLQKMLPELLTLTIVTQDDGENMSVQKVRPWFTLQENEDGTTTFLFYGIGFEQLTGGTLELCLPGQQSSRKMPLNQ